MADTAAEQAVALKNEGNALLGEGHFLEAIEKYSAAIELDDSNAIFFANRALVHLKLENNLACVEDADRAIDVDPTYAKAYYRKGSGLIALARWEEAKASFAQVVEMKPNDKDAKKKLQQCEKMMFQLKFAEAIAADEEYEAETSGFEALSSDGLEVEAGYTGPVWSWPPPDNFLADLVECYKGQGKLHMKYALDILGRVRDIFAAEPTLVEVDVPEGTEFTVCGDIHGQFYDLAKIFEVNGLPSETNPYLFNGDFVDRGSFAVEVIFTMLTAKVMYPNHFFMTRGNHESKNMNQLYGFSGEVKAKYNDAMMLMFTEIFQYLPLAAVIGSEVFVCHGGLFAQDGVTLADIRAIDRVREPPEDGLMCDLLWSDPQTINGRAPSKRGVGVQFGPDVVNDFLKLNDLSMVVRSHEVKMEGYELIADGKLCTVFSAPNYCDQMGNKGAFIRFNSDMQPTYTSFEAAPHPPIRPMAYVSLPFASMFGA